MNVTSEREPVTTDRPLLSVSRIKLFLRCPLAYQYRYLEQRPSPCNGNMLLGKAIHKALEVNFSQKIGTREDLPLRDVLEVCNKEFDSIRAQGVEFKDEEDPVEIKIKGLELLTLYLEKIAPKMNPAFVEQRFCFDLPDSPFGFQGYWDLVTKDTWIHDYKVVKRSYAADAAENDLQLIAYTLGYSKVTGKPPAGLTFQCMVKTKEPKLQFITTQPHSEKQLARLTKLACKVGEAMQSGIFYPTEDPMACGWCSYKDHCRESW